jgi:hypothetical protein
MPLYSVGLPKSMSQKEAGIKIEALGKAMQDPSYKRKKNRQFDLLVTHEDSAELYRAHYGAKVSKKKKGYDKEEDEEADN